MNNDLGKDQVTKNTAELQAVRAELQALEEATLKVGTAEELEVLERVIGELSALALFAI